MTSKFSRLTSAGSSPHWGKAVPAPQAPVPAVPAKAPQKIVKKK